MKLQIVAIVTAIALSSVALAPVYAATAKTVPATTAMTAKPAKAKTSDPQRFATEAAAQASCSTDTVVWANARSKIFHLKGTATYGKGKNGSYMCEAAATTEGFKATKKPEKQVASK